MSAQDEYYCIDDIEIWEARLVGEEQRGVMSTGEVLKMMSWGAVAEVEVLIRGRDDSEIPIRISQNIEGAIGCIVWPSAVVLSRFSYFISV